MKIICLGDSITKGVRPSISGLPSVSNKETFEYLLTRKLSEDGVKVEIVNSGIGSETTALALERFTEDVLDAQPDYLTIMYGTNDAAVNEGTSQPRVSLADYEVNLKSMISQAKAAGIEPILMTPIPMGVNWWYCAWSPYKEQGANCMINDYVEAVRRIAKEENIRLVDNNATWREWESETGSTVETLQTDSCHPNAAGHKLIAETIYEVVNPILLAK